MSERARTVGALVLLAATVLLIYGRTLGHGFIESEDRKHIEYVTGIVQEKGWTGLLLADYRQNPDLPLGYYRPIIQISFAVDDRLSGEAWFFHLTGLLAHLGSTLLLFALLRLLLGRLDAALVGALLFAAHPIQTECVAFIAARTDPWVGLFLLPAVIAWLRVRLRKSPRPGLEHALGAVAFAVAVFTKEIAYVAPAVLLVWDLLLPGGSTAPREWWRRNAGWLTAWGVATVVCLAVRLGPAATGFGPGSTGLEAGALPGVSAGVMPRLGALLTGLRLLVWPWPMSVAYLDETVRIGLVSVAGTVVVLGLCLAGAGRAARRGGLLGLVWIGVFLAPTSGLVTLASYHLQERFFYIPVMGLSIAAATLAARVLERPRGTLMVTAATAAMLAVFVPVSLARVAVWKDDATVWRHTVRTQPDAWVGHFYLAGLEMAAGRPDEALPGLRRTVELAPDFAPAWMEIGLAHAAAGRHEESLSAFLQARQVNPALPFVHWNLAVALRNLGRYGEAADAFRAELDYRAGDPQVHYDLAVALLYAGDLPGALRAADASLQRAPDNPESHNLRAVILLRLGRTDEVQRELDWLDRRAPDVAARLRQAIRAGRAP